MHVRKSRKEPTTHAPDRKTLPHSHRLRPRVTKPLLFVTGYAPPDRHGAFAALHEREGLELALFGGRHAHGATAAGEPPVPYREVAQRDVLALAASGDYRAVIAGTGGRPAPPAARAGAGRAARPAPLWGGGCGGARPPAP